MRKYDRDFKLNAIKLYLEGDQSISQWSKELNVLYSTLKGWINTYKKEAGEQTFSDKKRGHRGGEVVHQLHTCPNCNSLKKALALVLSLVNV